MEAFEIQVEVYTTHGTKYKHASKTFAATGWEAAHKVKGVIHNRMADIEYVKFLDWTILNPFQAHFPKDDFCHSGKKRTKK